MKPLFRGESRWRELRCKYCDQQWTGACPAAPAIIHQLAALEKTRGCQCSCRGPWPPRLRPPGRPGQRSADTNKTINQSPANFNVSTNFPQLQSSWDGPAVSLYSALIFNTNTAHGTPSNQSNFVSLKSAYIPRYHIYSVYLCLVWTSTKQYLETVCECLQLSILDMEHRRLCS